MTIAVAIRTGSAVVFAADSKVTTAGIVGVQEDGTPSLMDQTYDNATKVVHDAGETLMAIVASYSNIGAVSATDFISRITFGEFTDAAPHDAALSALVGSMMEQHRAYWSPSGVAEERWSGPTLL